MVPDGRPAAKFVASLVLICLSVTLAWSITPKTSQAAADMEIRVADRARLALEHAIDRARATGDVARVKWLEETLESQQAFHGEGHRHNAGGSR